jgi:dipeptide/tripeptide permease
LVWVGLLLAGFLADRWGGRTALLTFAALLLPVGLASHATHALEVLRLPLREIREVRPNPGQ